MFHRVASSNCYKFKERLHIFKLELELNRQPSIHQSYKRNEASEFLGESLLFLQLRIQLDYESMDNQ